MPQPRVKRGFWRVERERNLDGLPVRKMRRKENFAVSKPKANVHGRGEGARHGTSEATPEPTKSEQK